MRKARSRRAVCRLSNVNRKSPPVPVSVPVDPIVSAAPLATRRAAGAAALAALPLATLLLATLLLPAEARAQDGASPARRDAAAAGARSVLQPSAWFVQAGTTRRTHALTAGLNWDWPWQWRLGSGRLDGYWEASVSNWSVPAPDGRRTAALVQYALVPVLRYVPSQGDARWFAEIGIGATLTNRLYESDRKRFSTRFNFGDHLGVGWTFGEQRRHEIALRIEHFSNADIKLPNPGETFVQLRYSRRLP